MKIDIELILENLKMGKSKRAQNSLDKLNALLESHFNAGEKDYSIAAIGTLSKANGGIGLSSLRNTSGTHFRLLVEAWAAKADTTLKKPKKPKSYESPSDIELLKLIPDPALRAVFGQIMAERKKLRSENNTLKKSADVFVDMRPNQVVYTPQSNDSITVVSSLNGILLNSDIAALEDAISEERMLRRGWTVSELGAVKDEYNRPLFKNGFVSAIRKILKQL